MKLYIEQSYFLQIMHEQSILPKVFKFLLNSNTEALDLTKQGRLFQMSVPLKYIEFAPYTVDFADGSDKLYNKFLTKIGPNKLEICFRHS